MESAETDEMAPALDPAKPVPRIVSTSPLLDGLRVQAAASRVPLRDLITASHLPGALVEDILGWAPPVPMSVSIRWAFLLDALAGRSGRVFRYLPGRRATIAMEQIAVRLLESSDEPLEAIAEAAGLATPGNDWFEGGAEHLFAGLDRLGLALGTAPVLLPIAAQQPS